jgi:hypothetical protein
MHSRLILTRGEMLIAHAVAPFFSRLAAQTTTVKTFSVNPSVIADFRV